MKTLSRATAGLFVLGLAGGWSLSAKEGAPKAKKSRATPALADPVPLTDVESAKLLGPDLADLDGDGKLDLVTGDYAGNFFFFRNESKKAAVRFAKPKTLTTGGKAIKLPHW